MEARKEITGGLTNVLTSTNAALVEGFLVEHPEFRSRLA